MQTSSVTTYNNSSQSEWSFLMNLQFSEVMIVAAKVSLYHQLCSQYNFK